MPSSVQSCCFDTGVRVDAFQFSEFVLGRLLVSSVRATVLFDSGATHSFIALFYLILFVSIFGSNQSHSFISQSFVSINGIQSNLLPSPLASYLVVLSIHISQCTYMYSQSRRLVSQTLLQLS